MRTQPLGHREWFSERYIEVVVFIQGFRFLRLSVIVIRPATIEVLFLRCECVLAAVTIVEVHCLSVGGISCFKFQNQKWKVGVTVGSLQCAGGFRAWLCVTIVLVK